MNQNWKFSKRHFLNYVSIFLNQNGYDILSESGILMYCFSYVFWHIGFYSYKKCIQKTPRIQHLFCHWKNNSNINKPYLSNSFWYIRFGRESILTWNVYRKPLDTSSLQYWKLNVFSSTDNHILDWLKQISSCTNVFHS